MPILRGSCRCGGIKYEINGPLVAPSNCHCTMCRKQHGAAFRSRARVEISDFAAPSAQDHKIVGISDEASAEALLEAELLPSQHKPAHVKIRQQW